MSETSLHLLLALVQWCAAYLFAIIYALLAQEWINKWRKRGYTIRQIAEGLDLDIRTAERMASGRTKMPKKRTIARMGKMDEEHFAHIFFHYLAHGLSIKEVFIVIDENVGKEAIK